MTDHAEAHPVPSTMRVSLLRAPGQVEVAERPVPEAGPGEVLVRVASVGICGSDVHYYRHGRIGPYIVRDPLVLGHEASGTVVAVGPDVPAERVGQRVALEPGVPCGHCSQCRAGRYNLCPDVRFFATPPIDGAFAEFVTIAADFAHPVPDHVSEDAAALVEPLSVGVWACHKAAVGIGDSVLVTGAGPVGLVTVQVAAAAGAGRIVVTDLSPERLAAAERFGATEVVDTRETDLAHLEGRIDSFIDCSGAPAAISQGLQTVRGGGRVVLVGMGADEISLPVALVQGRELTVTGTFRYANTYPTAIDLVATGRVELDSLVTDRFPLAEAEAALRSAGDPGTVKAVVRPGE
ncbi:NAD(P)-dependent alcohol dehydrogenase [Ornithinicoccus hortensis]|uniref:L-iditol 2-dehydrogenase n=1 Tax=Ornithinicoccus hortensis TaxID=82346 RepID=A0A542YUL9_9MICO|nr:NAD(P)-dependent alcohol dehydrogenase [Ornithinicoccus hortensis]TQL51654.1 L-iditol 2-dehydrogenase [Ornithinicoccus hortensis]